MNEADDSPEFLESVKKAGAFIDEGHFDMYKYALYYCMIDVDIQ